MQDPEGLIAELEKTGEEYASFIEAQSNSDFHSRPGPEDWSAAEMTGHLAEALVTFSEQAQQVSQQAGMVIGRDPDDPGRLAAVGTFAQATPAEAAAAVRDAVRLAASTLRQIPPEGWERTAQHRRYGEVKVSEIVERFLIAHCGNHLAQARTAVASAGGGSSTGV
jgi:alkanesulfonate monooxygenase SsuD/methylene tetrahydromethanopterin reductase-like flavin-dependent oxidoreductase (luciferase family)